MKNESQLTSQIKNLLKSKGAYCEKIFGGGYQASGIPDILCCYRGYFLAIEVKSPTGKGRASDIQKLKIKAIRDAGGVAFITDNIEDVERVLKFIDDGNLELLPYNDRYL
jgi:Holliday junction resolvase